MVSTQYLVLTLVFWPLWIPGTNTACESWGKFLLDCVMCLLTESRQWGWAGVDHSPCTIRE